MSRKIPEAQLATWRAFLTAHATVIEQIEHELAGAGAVPLTSYDVLVALVEAPGRRRRLHELAEAVLLSRSGLTRLLDRLEAEGFLEREPCESDRRGAYAVLTEKGVHAVRRAWPIYARGIRAHFAQHLMDNELETLHTAFERIVHAERLQQPM